MSSSDLQSRYKFFSKEELSGNKSSYSDPAWWKEAVVFQIWPSSFCDSNGDGIGDLQGIISKLDYLKDLGADVLWLSPIYESPNKDMGYDVANYRKIAERYGTHEDVDTLISELRKRDMKLMMDLVVNHTSDEHQWFKESRSSLTNSKRDWYIWRKPRFENGNRKEPNNWCSFFNGSAWQFDEATGEYYLALFTKEQPDLNWENPEVRKAVHDVMRYWLDRGVAGFRCDVINEISKTYNPDGSLPDAEVVDHDQEFQPATHLFCNGPRVHEFVRELNEEVLSHYDTITVGETPHARHPDEVLPWVNPDRRELRMCFQFDFMNLDTDQYWPLIPRKWKLPELKAVVNKWQSYMHSENGWNSSYIENHDQARSVSRWASDKPEFREQGAKMIALMHTTCGGTIYVYQGQEIGMKNMPKDWPMEEYLDVMSINFYKDQERLRSQGKNVPSAEEVFRGIQSNARDHARTPVQWSSGPQAGFTSGKPWMRVDEEDAKAGWNAEAQINSPTSILSFWKSMLAFRKDANLKALVYGNFNLLSPQDPNIFSYVRNLEDSPSVLVILNFSDKVQTYEIKEDDAFEGQKQVEFKSKGIVKGLKDVGRNARELIGTREGKAQWEGNRITLEAYEGRMFALD